MGTDKRRFVFDDSFLFYIHFIIKVMDFFELSIKSRNRDFESEVYEKILYNFTKKRKNLKIYIAK